MQPGETIAPGGNTPASPPPMPAEPAPSPAPPQPQPEPSPPSPPPDQTPPSTSWTYHGNSTDQAPGVAAAAPSSPAPANPVSWVASEYIAHHKSLNWFVLVCLGVIVLGVVMYFITEELITPIVVGLVGLSFGIFGARQPRQLEYAVDGIGVHIGAKFYPYQIFRSFSVLHEETARSILIMPLRRFGLPITLYYAPDVEDRILDILGQHLPHEVRQVAPIDRVMSKIRF